MTSLVTTAAMTTRNEELALFKTICADFEDILPNDLHNTFSKYLGRPYLGLITPHDSPSSSPPNNNNSNSSAQSTPTTPTTTTTGTRATRTPPIVHEKLAKGIVWGSSLRTIISLSVQLTDSILTLSGTKFPIHVHFLYLPVSPQTYLSEEALNALGIEDMVIVGEHSIAPTETPMDPATSSPNNPFSAPFLSNPFTNSYKSFNSNTIDGTSGGGGGGGGGGCGNGGYSSPLLRLPLRINGYKTMVARSPSEGHFSHLNILGQDFIQLSGAKVFFGGQIPRFEISFR